jgi:hypothetical protein
MLSRRYDLDPPIDGPSAAVNVGVVAVAAGAGWFPEEPVEG